MAETKLKPEQAEVTARFKLTTHTYDISTASGSQTLTGAGFTPKGAMLIGSLQNSIAVSIGMSDGTGHYNVEQNGVANQWYPEAKVLTAIVTPGNMAQATIAFNADGGVLTWTKTGTPTGTLYFSVLWFR